MNEKRKIEELLQQAEDLKCDLTYRKIGTEFPGGHEVVKHSIGEYVRGDAYTNTVESYFALLKRGLHGTFHHVSPKHLERYCDEFSFRWSHRRESDGERTVAAIKSAEGRRLTYKMPTNNG